ncbi:hypothetical protein ES705_15240 [subsurface metagenome]
MKNRPELLTPAQDWNSLKVISGLTDAIYFGVQSYNMRLKAKNFERVDLEKVANYCHDQNPPMKAYLTTNILIYDSELQDLVNLITEAKEAGIDAIIAHDIAAIQIAKRNNIDFHISTQANVSNIESARFYEELGADNTIVVYTSDHGDLMGDQGMLFKGPSTYMGVLHIPMIWKVPKITNPATTDALMSSIDYPKTILNLLGIKEKQQPSDMQGYNITSILREPENPEMQPRDCCLIEEDEEIGPLNVRLRHLITKDHKLTIYEGHKEFGDLFDRKNDLNELNNLWFDSDHNNIRFSLVNRLLQECLKTQTRYPKRIAGT